MSGGIILFFIFGQPVSLFAGIMLFIWLLYFCETYLNIRQYKTVFKSSVPPRELSTLVTQEEFMKSKLYSIDKFRYSFVHDAYEVVKMTAVLYYAVIPWLWSLVTSHSVLMNEFALNTFGINLGINAKSETTCSLIFWIYVTAFQTIESLPWNLFYTFVLEEKHGFNKQTLSFFLKDCAKVFIVSLLLSLPILSLLIWIIKYGGHYFYLYAYGFSLIITLIMMFIYPEFIAPLFDRYEPLPQGELRQKIEALAASISFPLKKLLVVQGSKRSSHSNAYFYGFWKNKRIVLYDTLIQGFKFPEKPGVSPSEKSETNDDDSKSHGCAVDEEIVAVLGHELGHWKCGHTIVNLVVSQANLLLMFVVFASLVNINTIFYSFGFSSDVPILLRLLIIFQFIFSPYNTVIAFLMTVLSRRLEFQADDFAVNLGYGNYLKSALLVLHKDNLAFPVTDWLYSLVYHSHPPLLERITALDVSISKRQ